MSGRLLTEMTFATLPPQYDSPAPVEGSTCQSEMWSALRNRYKAGVSVQHLINIKKYVIRVRVSDVKHTRE